MRFCYDNLSEGGRDGLVIDDFFLDPYKNDIWDFTEYWRSGGRAVPVQFEHPQVHSEWHLAIIAADAKAAGFRDENLIHEATAIGHRSYSNVIFDNKVCLFANHAGFFNGDHESFVHKKSEEDRHGFEKPKLHGSHKYPPRLTCRLHPRGVAVQPKPDGTVKRRLTCDAGWPRVSSGSWERDGRAARSTAESEWAFPGEDGPDRRSFNEHCPLQDPLRVPPESRKYGTVDAFARGTAVLKSSGIKVGLWAHDLRAYYRYMVTQNLEAHCSVQWVECEHGFEEDFNLQFGAAMNCAKATGMSAFFSEMIRKALHEEQQRWRDEGLLDGLPQATREALHSWEAERGALAATELATAREEWRAAKLSAAERQAREKEWQRGAERRTCPWFVDAFMIDDFFGSVLDFFLPTVLATVKRVFDRYNVTLADGRIDKVTGLPSPNKHQVSFESMVILGVEISVETEAGWRRLTDERAAAYAGAAREMAAADRVPVEQFQSLLGKLVFAVQSIPRLRGLVAGLLGLVEQKWGARRTMRIGPSAGGMLRLAATALERNEGMVLYPMEQPPGAAGRPVVWVFTDAARNEEAAARGDFVGYGAFVWLEGLDTVFCASGAWLPGEQSLHIAALEMHCANIGIELAQHVVAAVCGGYDVADDMDVVMVTDSLSAAMVARGVRARSPALRVLVQERMERMAARPQQRVLTAHAFREESQEADDASKADFVAFRRKLNTRFGREMRIVMLPPPAAAIRSLQRAWEAERAGAA